MDVAIAEKRHDFPGQRNGHNSEERLGKRFYKAAWQALDRDFVKSRMFNPNHMSNAEIKRRFDEIRQSKELIQRKNEMLSAKNPFRDSRSPVREKIVSLALQEDQAKDQRRRVIYEVLKRMVEAK